MTNKIIHISDYLKPKGFTDEDINASNMLQEIAKSNPKHAFVISWPADGTIPTYHSSTGDTPVILMRLQEFIHQMFSGEFYTKND